MKKVLLLIVSALFINLGVNAQKKKVSYSDEVYGKQSKSLVVLDSPSYMLSSGQLLQRASKELLIGGGSAVVCGGLCAVAASLNDKDSRNAVFIAGGVFGLASLVMGTKGIITLGKAGKVLDRERTVAYLKPSGCGFGINLTF